MTTSAFAVKVRRFRSWQYGKVAPACPVCLGRGWIAEREGLS